MRLTKEMTFAAAHRLRDYQGKCSTLHGHEWKVQVIVEGEQGPDGIIVDFNKLKQILKEEIDDRFDHKYLNEIPPFDKINPTAENMARIFYHLLHDRETKVAGVRVWETPTSCVEYIRE